MNAIVIVYYNKTTKKLKVLDFELAVELKKHLAEDWEHTATLNAATFIEYLFNEADDRSKEIEKLKLSTKHQCQ